MRTTYDLMTDATPRQVKAAQRGDKKLERLERLAAPMVGELATGEFYVWPAGGRLYRNTSHSACVDYLIRNNYVS
jgi:hypothetical protein